MVKLNLDWRASAELKQWYNNHQLETLTIVGKNAKNRRRTDIVNTKKIRFSQMKESFSQIILDWKHCVGPEGNIKHNSPKEVAQEIKENIKPKKAPGCDLITMENLQVPSYRHPAYSQ